jgi:hypothetical protein
VQTWRDTTPPQVQDDLDALATAALDAAEGLLAKRGEFFPFAVTVRDDGEIGLAAADPALGERPASSAVLEALYAGISGDRQAYRAAGFVADVRLAGGDAVRVDVEHRDGGPPLTLVTPYRCSGLLRKTVTYGQMEASDGVRRIWPDL